MKEDNNLPSLSDSDMVTSDVEKTKSDVGRKSRKVSTIALAIALTTASATMIKGCELFISCDSDTSQTADSYDDGSYDTGSYADSYDVGEYDLGSVADPCY